MPQPTREQVLDTLGRIERSKGFRRSLRMTRFLRFIVEGKLDGRIDDLREIVLGMEVFDRGDSFDPAEDNIVRVDAARLRSKLADYYEHEGASEAVRISMPKGGYVPEFEIGATKEASDARRLRERGFRHLRRWTEGEVAKAVSVFEAARNEHPEEAWPHEGLASCRIALVEIGYGDAAVLLDRAYADAQRAAELQPVSAGPVLLLGTVDLLSWRLDEAEKRAEQAMKLDAESARAHALLGRILALRSDAEEALEELERAVGLDPDDERARLRFGWELCLQGASEEALQQAHAAAYFEPGLHGPHLLAAAVHCNEGSWDEALAAAELAAQRAPTNPWADALRAYALGRSGGEAQPIIDSLAERAAAGEISSVCLAAARLGAGQCEQAKADLDAAFERRDPQLARLRLAPFGDLANMIEALTGTQS